MHNETKKVGEIFEIPICGTPGDFASIGDVRIFVVMFITHIMKWRKQKATSDDNLYTEYKNYRLSEAYCTADGKPRNRVVMGLCELDDFSKHEIKELGDLLTSIIDHGELVLASSQKVSDKALYFYNKYKEKKQLEHEVLEENDSLRKEGKKG